MVIVNQSGKPSGKSVKQSEQGGAIFWYSGRQPVVALSSCEAELIAANEAV